MVNHNFHKTVSHVSSSPAVSWQTKLQEWVSQATPGENRKEAARRIAHCIETKTDTLDFCKLGLTTLPPKEVFANLSKIERLSLHGNRIQRLEAGSFTGLSMLSTLILGENQIQTIESGAFAGLSKLVKLLLNHNQIQRLQPGAFSGLSRLQILYLDDSPLQTIEPGTFAGLSALTTLSLVKNRIQRLEAGVFTGLSELHDLHLQQNSLQEIDPGAFAGMHRLGSIDMERNQLSTLPDLRSLCRGLSGEVTIDLSSNPLNLSSTERITAYNAEPGPHPTITFTNFDANVRAEDALISPERPLSAHVKQWLPDLSPEDAALWMALQEAKPQEASALATFLTRLFNECPRQEGKVDAKLTEKIYDLLTSIQEALQEALKKDFEEGIKPESFVMRCLSNARLGNGTCIDKVKVAYVLNQYEVQRHHLGKMAPTSVVTSKREEVEAKIKLIHHTINFVSQVANREIFFDNQLKEFVTLEEAVERYNQENPGSELPLRPDEAYTGNMETFGAKLLVNLQSLTGDRYRVVRIGDETEDVLKLTYELTGKDPFIHQVDMRFESCCTIGKNPEYLQAALAYLARIHENPSSSADRQPIPAG